MIPPGCKTKSISFPAEVELVVTSYGTHFVIRPLPTQSEFIACSMEIRSGKLFRVTVEDPSQDEESATGEVPC